MRVLFFESNTYSPQVIDPAEANWDLLLASEGGTLWVDMEGPSADDVRVMRNVFHFHPLTIEDAGSERQRPKLEEFNMYMFAILNPITFVSGEIDFRELSVFAGNNYLVTVHSTAEPLIDEALARCQNPYFSLPMSSGYLLYTLIDLVIDRYFPVLDTIGDELDALEDGLLRQPGRVRLPVRLYELRRALSEMWRVTSQQRDFFGILSRRQTDYPHLEALSYYLRDVYDHLLRASDTINQYREMLTNIVDLANTAASNRLNATVQRLTVITVITGTLAVITGFYGMNFERTFPDFSDPNGVFFVVTLMLASVLVILLMAWRR